MPTAKIIDLGRQGDGILLHEGRKIFISGVLTDETVEYTMENDARARLEKVVVPSKDRAEPVCPYFGQCGGCSLQHMKPEAYQAFKMRYLKELFPESWSDVEIETPVFVDPKSRRRVSFAVAWNGNVRWVGLNPKNSDKILQIKSCSILVPELERMIEPLRHLISDKTLNFSKRRGVGDISLLATETGVDVLFTLPFSPDFNWIQSVTDFAVATNAARVSWRYSERHEAEPLIVPHVPVLTMGEAFLKPPAGVFLQPSVSGEKALVAAVSDYVGEAKKIMDLFCGAGTFTLPLLKKKRVLEGADNAAEALSALEAASAGRIKTQERDLFKVPFLADELEGFDAVIFDPPRAGAKAQCEQLAFSNVPVIAAVSCNPTSFVRDAEILMNGGYKLKRIRPIDQFVYTPHMELAALFARK